ncbi:MAG: hypothetical protein RR365_14075, partial [Bacteroides sp.]
MKQFRKTLSCLLFVTLALLASACNPDDTPKATKSTMEVSFSRGGGDSGSTSTEAVTGMLVFWELNTNNKYRFTVPDLNSTEEYDTHELYPADGTNASATGFSPAHLSMSTDDKTLSLPSGTAPGTIDVCASNTIQGSMFHPFTDKMTFAHTLTKVTFYAHRDKTMVGSRNVRNIQVTVPYTYLATQWTYSDSDKKYVTSDDSSTTGTVLTLTHPGIIVNTETVEVGTCYLRLPAASNGVLTNIILAASTSLINSTETKEISSTLNVQLKHDDG